MSRKLITPIARETICYSKYREVCDIISMTIHAAVWRKMRHNAWCVPPPPRTDSIINGPASSYYFTSFYIYHAGAPAKPQGCHILNNVAFLYPTPQTLALDSGRDTHAHTHSKEGNGHCQENRSQRKWLRDEHQKGQSQDTLEKRKKGSCVFMFVCRRKPA